MIKILIAGVSGCIFFIMMMAGISHDLESRNDEYRSFLKQCGKDITAVEYYNMISSQVIG